ncbi:MAG TPA: CPBP family glutamic-type intramembrane protease [Candidatus Dormibacteraeota bacterium]
MAAKPQLGAAQPRPSAVAALRAGILMGGLAAAMTLRLASGGAAGSTSQPAAVLFAAVLLALGLLSGWRPVRGSWPSRARGAGMGLGGATLLCALPLAHRLWVGVPAVPRPAWGMLLTWSLATFCVAVAEEVLLRGALFDAVRRTGAGEAAAVAVAAVAFAVIHVPMYGPGALPLDLGVGVLLGCLRVASGGVTAPATAHAGADLALWWVW